MRPSPCHFDHTEARHQWTVIIVTSDLKRSGFAVAITAHCSKSQDIMMTEILVLLS